MVKRGAVGTASSIRRRSAAWSYFAGLDVSVKDTSVCIGADTGRIVREVKVASEPDALLAVLTNPAYRFKRIGLEAGPLSQWLFSALAEAGLSLTYRATVDIPARCSFFCSCVWIPQGAQ